MNHSWDYITDSLEQHLFFARIMKEHSLFLSAGFLSRDQNCAEEGIRFLRQFESLLSRAISLSNCVIHRCVLDSGELFTEFTDCAEQQTQRLTGICIDRELTARTKKLTARDHRTDPQTSQILAHQVQHLNRDALSMVERLIKYKECLLSDISSCHLFTSNYPLLIEHILREARLYRAQLMRLEGLNDCSCQELRNSELFWNQIMMEHALFIRGLLDPSEDALISTANDFAESYRHLLDASTAASDKVIASSDSLALTRKFRDFKCAGVKGIEACEIRSLILPLLADHVLREANHYIRLLRQ